MGWNNISIPKYQRLKRWNCVIKWKHFPRYWPFVRGIHRSLVNSPHKGQWRGALMFSLICAWINGWENNREAGDLRRYRARIYVIILWSKDALYIDGIKLYSYIIMMPASSIPDGEICQRIIIKVWVREDAEWFHIPPEAPVALKYWYSWCM